MFGALLLHPEIAFIFPLVVIHQTFLGKTNMCARPYS